VRSHGLDRLQLFFTESPPEAIRTQLKASYWRWNPARRAWERKITAAAERALARFLAGAEESVDRERASS
jgi:hypothetical protein